MGIDFHPQILLFIFEFKLKLFFELELAKSVGESVVGGGILVLIFTNQILLFIFEFKLKLFFEFELAKSVGESVGWGRDLGIDFHH